jgi:hypothetical protein
MGGGVNFVSGRWIHGVAALVVSTLMLPCVAMAQDEAKEPAPVAEGEPEIRPEDLIYFHPRLVKGQRAVYRVKTHDVQKENGVDVRKPRSWSGLAEVEVLETEPHFVVAYRTDALSAEIFGENTNAITKQFVEQLRAVPPVEIVFTHEGEMLGMRNWDAVRKPALEVSRMMMRSLGKNRPEEMTATVNNFIEQMYSEDGLGMQMIAGEARTCFAGLGHWVERGKPTEEATTFANPMGGDPLPGMLKMWDLPQDEGSNLVTIEYRSKLDQEAAGKMVADLLRKMTGKEPPEGGVLINSEEDMTFTYDQSLGWMQRTVWERRMWAEKSERTQYREFVLETPPEVMEEAAPAEWGDAIVLAPKFEKGQRAVYETSLSIQFWDDSGALVRDDQVEKVRLEMQVLETEPNYVLAISPRFLNASTVLTDDAKLKKVIDADVRELEGKLGAVEVVIAPDGEFLEVRNLDKVCSEVSSAFVGLINQKKDVLKPEMLARATENFTELMKPDLDCEPFVSSAFEDCIDGWGHGAYRNRDAAEPTTFTLPVLAEDVPAMHTVKSLERDPNAKVEIVERMIATDDEEARKIAHKWAVDVGLRKAEDPADDVHCQEVATFSYDKATGWLTKVTCERSYQLLKTKRVEKQTFVLVEGPTK